MSPSGVVLLLADTCQFLTALGRPVHIVNLDPATPNPSYPCAINITDLITLDQVMEEYNLGPNGAMIYVVEYLEANLDWLIDRLDSLLSSAEGLGEGGGYIIFDTPGQVELWTNHDSLRRVIERLTKMDYRVSDPRDRARNRGAKLTDVSARCGASI